MSAVLGTAMMLLRADSGGLAGDMAKAKNAVDSGLGGIGGRISGLMGAAFGALGISQFVGQVREGIGMFKEASILNTRMEATLAATGGAAGFTADQMRAMAEEIQNTTMHEGDSILGLQAKLMKFDSIHGETFKRALMAALDLSDAYGIGVEGGINTVGRALQFPDRAGQMLRRTIGGLTAEQEKQIKSFMKAGEVGKAQAVVLDAIAAKAPGVAKALGATPVGKMEIMKNKLGDLKEALGQAFLPLATKFLELQMAVTKAFTVIANVVSVAISAIDQFNTATGGMAAELAKIVGIALALGYVLPKVQVGIQLVSAAMKAMLVSSGWGIVLVALGTVVVLAIKLWEYFSKMKVVQDAMAAAADRFKIVWVRINAMLSKFLAMFGINVSGIIEFLGGLFASAVDIVSEFVLDAVEWMQAGFENINVIWSALPEIIRYVTLLALDYFIAWRTAIPQYIGYALQLAFHKIMEWGGKVLEFIAGIPVAIASFFVEIPGLVAAALSGSLTGENINFVEAVFQKQIDGMLAPFKGFIAGASGELFDWSTVVSDETKRAGLTAAKALDPVVRRKRELEAMRKGPEVAAAAAGKGAGKGVGKEIGEEAAAAFALNLAEIIPSGFSGFEQFGKTIQENLLKSIEKDAAMRTAKASEGMEGLMGELTATSAEHLTVAKEISTSLKGGGAVGAVVSPGSGAP